MGVDIAKDGSRTLGFHLRHSERGLRNWGKRGEGRGWTGSMIEDNDESNILQTLFAGVERTGGRMYASDDRRGNLLTRKTWHGPSAGKTRHRLVCIT
ncbi:hypothetical protein AG1IA_00647 [Rhizoctonia solani AG-1 IA]|uniref:Uncharacterized protein n=1 Tax=Thanatephorus cucumeris (strain AG1-IA) TaxID=983506 RepID=L8X9H8_THACA|nr:hypothetical protein AG1IA_00647 [Rhizoctonia solani AG-1 IA]